MRAEELSTAVASWWRWSLLAGVLLLGTLGVVAASQYSEFSRATADIQSSEDVISAADRLLSVMVEAENGYRGYLLTGNPVFLEPYRGVDQRAREAVVTLTGLLANDVRRLDDLTRLSSLVDARLAGMASSLALYDRGAREAAVEPLRDVSGKRTMDGIRLLGAQLKSAERMLSANRSLQAASAARAARGFGISAGVVALLLAFLGWSISRTMEQRRVELASATIARLEAERDVTRSAAELAQSESFNRSLLDSSADVITVLTASGEVSLLNQASLRLLSGPDGRDWVGTPFPALWPAHGEAATTAVQQAVDGGQGRFAASHADSDGHSHWWDVIVTSVKDADGRVTRFIATARDVTQQRRADDERQALLASERAARSEAERLARIKDDFVATLSHELRTPLNAILGWVGVLRQDQSEETLAKALEVIDRNSRRQSQMVDDLLDLGRILSGKMRIEVQRLDLATVIEEAILSVQPSADAKGVRLVTMLGSAAVVRGDPGRLLQVVWNLLSNAIKFTPRGGQVQVTVHKVHSQVHLQVSDTGIGMAPELVGQIFDRFRQADASTTRRHGGLGLGLSIARSLLELHGGTVDAASDGEHRGSTFTVRLPIALTSTQPDSRTRPAAAAQPAGASLDGLRVLVLDDEEDAREIVTRLLQDAGATVTAVASATAATRLLDDGFMPDVVVSDIGMPDQDGYDFIRGLRHMPEPLSSVPAAALTALARLEDRKRALLSGFQSHLAKPVDPAELVAMVASLARRTGRR